jgi:hypothetical protein
VRKGWERNPLVWLAFILIALLILYSCGRKAYSAYRIGEAATIEFHNRLDRAGYEQIYVDATEEFRRHGSRAEELAFLEKVHIAMGNKQASHLQGFHVNTFNGVTYVALRNATTFDKGSADEQFVWQINDSGAKLYGYHIDSSNFR